MDTRCDQVRVPLRSMPTISTRERYKISVGELQEHLEELERNEQRSTETAHEFEIRACGV